MLRVDAGPHGVEVQLLALHDNRLGQRVYQVGSALFGPLDDCGEQLLRRDLPISGAKIVVSHSETSGAGEPEVLPHLLGHHDQALGQLRGVARGPGGQPRALCPARITRHIVKRVVAAWGCWLAAARSQ